MSDYVRKKVVCYPITTEDAKVLGLGNESDIFDLEYRDDLENLFGFEVGKFEPDCFVDYTHNYNARYYLTYILEYDYGCDTGDWGRARLLTANEQEKYSKIFFQILPSIDASKFKLIEYCFYNCCECMDYYINDEDSFLKEV